MIICIVRKTNEKVINKNSLCETYSFTLLVQNPKLLSSRHLIVGTVLLYFIRTRDVVELLTKLCVLPVVDRLTGRRTAAIARRHALDSWSDGVYRLVRWRRSAQNFIVVWFDPTKLTHLPRPREVSNRQTNAEHADGDLATHVGLTAAFNELRFAVFKDNSSMWLTNCLVVKVQLLKVLLWQEH